MIAAYREQHGTPGCKDIVTIILAGLQEYVASCSYPCPLLLIEPFRAPCCCMSLISLSPVQGSMLLHGHYNILVPCAGLHVGAWSLISLTLREDYVVVNKKFVILVASMNSWNVQRYFCEFVKNSCIPMEHCVTSGDKYTCGIICKQILVHALHSLNIRALGVWRCYKTTFVTNSQ